MSDKREPGTRGGHSRGWRFLSQWRFQVVLIPVAIWALIFFYLPALGNIIAFQDYRLDKGYFHSSFVGLKQFSDFLQSQLTLVLLRNTLIMSFLGLVAGTIAAIIFAILLNEIVRSAPKRLVQTASYLPYFVSMAICANLFIQLLSRTGPFNGILLSLGIVEQPVPFLEIGPLFWWIITAQSVWKNVGWNAIIYIAAITAIDPQIFEAAYVDGAGRTRRIWHITLPLLLPTVAILLILNSGYLIMGGFEQQLLMFNPVVMDYAEVLQTYVYKRGIGHQQYSFAAAVNLFQSVVSVTTILVVNRLFKRFTDTSIW